MKRAIEKNPDLPFLSEEVVQLLGRLCFRQDDPPEKCDLIFQFSTINEIEKVVAIIDDLLSRSISNQVFITGGIPGYEDSTKESESQAVLDLIDRKKYPGVSFYSEERSGNTLENITEALKVLDFRNYPDILFICKSHAARRAHLTLKSLLPGCNLIQRTYSTQYEGADKEIDPSTWHSFDFGRSRVWGEYLRIRNYSRKGDFLLDKETIDVMAEIELRIEN